MKKVTKLHDEMCNEINKRGILSWIIFLYIGLNFIETILNILEYLIKIV